MTISIARLSLMSLAAAGALGAAVLAASTPARADGPWCGQYGGHYGGTNCGFYSYHQCMAAMSGTGGSCRPNPWYAYERPY